MFRRLLVLALLLLASNLFADDWQFIGPKDFGAPVSSLAVDPKNADHVSAGAASGGLWERKSTNEPWRYVNTGFPVIGGGAIAIHPNVPSVIYTGTGEVYGYRHTASRGFD